MTQPRHRAKRNRKGTPKPKGLSPEVLEAVGKVLPGIIRAVAVLVEALRAR
jgi:hypothetical protein